MSADSPYSLESLERRWQLEKTPQVGLRLAEQYRRQGNLSASIEALTAGLETYPTHTSSRVALSRYLVDGERFEEAVPHLEKIVTLDPTHLVANKLLVGAYAGVGRLEDARDKLAIYEMMAEGDADIDRLHELVSESGSRGSSRLVPTHSEEEQVMPPLAPVAPAGEAAGSKLGARSENLLPSAKLESHSIEATSEFARGSVNSAESPQDVSLDLPFGQIEVPEPELAPEPAARTASVDEPFGLAMTPAKPDAYWQKVADEGIFSFETPEPAEPVRFEVEGEAGSGAVTLEPDLPGEEPSTTATLGNLYLEQGHKREAKEVFEEVLQREPENEVAQSGLEETREPESAPLALEAAAEPDATNEIVPATSVVERKKQILITYLGQIRQAVAAGV